MQRLAETPRPTKACAHCRDKKIKCGGGIPCKSCQRHQEECWYPTSRRGKRPRSSSSVQRTTSQDLWKPRPASNTADELGVAPPGQIHDSNPLLTPSQISSETPDNHDRESAERLAGPGLSSGHHAGQDPGNPEASLEEYPRQLPLPDSGSRLSPSQPQEVHFRSPSTITPLMQMEKEVDGLGGTADGEEEVIPLQKVNWEHHGPWSWVSVCSRPGVRWVCERTKSDEFSEVASGLTRTWSRRLKMKRYRPLQIKYPDPALALAWKYVEGYFEQSYDAVFGIVHRPSFEARLHAHFENPTAAAQDDGPSWFALRNIIFAAGSRCVLAADPTVSFVQAEVQAAQYFQNALSVFSEIIFGHSGFTAVQALALMAFYSEGLGSPALEYPLCTNAVQLAQARGLHREPPKSWGLSASDDLNRRWLWWAIYCLEKQIAFRSGRPSLIDDNNISTTIPTSAPPGSTNDVEAFTLIVRHAQISSQISHRIMSVKAFKQAPAQVLDTVHDIHNKLQELLHSLPADLSVDPSESGDSRRPRPRWTQSLYLHFAIHGSLMATHIILFYPWIAARFGTESDPVFHNQVLSSSKTIANSARQIIRILRSVTTDIAAPAWLTFYYPMYAHINLFVYLLKFPSLSSVLGDLALLDMCTGHFGHIEHVTNSDISFHFPRESAALCLKFIKANQPQGRERETAPGTPQAGANPTLHSNRSRNDLEDIDSQLTSSASRDLTNGNLFDAMDIDVESWNIFSSIDITSDLTAAFGAFVPVEKETNESSTS